MSNARTPEEIREAFAALRYQCDPRGYKLLDALESMTLIDQAFINLHERVGSIISAPAQANGSTPSEGEGGAVAKAEAENHSRHYSLPDHDGYTVGSSKYEALRLVEGGER